MKRLLMVSLIILNIMLGGCKNASITGKAVDEPIECKDSDGGINKDIQGIVSINEEDYADECVAGLLIEYYCDGGNKANQNVRCPNKCDAGKCI